MILEVGILSVGLLTSLFSARKRAEQRTPASVNKVTPKLNLPRKEVTLSFSAPADVDEPLAPQTFYPVTGWPPRIAPEPPIVVTPPSAGPTASPTIIQIQQPVDTEQLIPRQQIINMLPPQVSNAVITAPVVTPEGNTVVATVAEVRNREIRYT